MQPVSESSMTKRATWFKLVAPSSSPPASKAEIVDLITLPGSVARVPCERPILLDGGASCNFITRSLVTRFGARSLQLPQRIQVRMANGHSILCTDVLVDVEISVPGYRGVHDLVVMPEIDGFDVVLGRPFLKSSGAVIDHLSSTVVWRAGADFMVR